jgi:putative thioredoxin
MDQLIGQGAPGANAAGGALPPDLIKDSDEKSFGQDVLQASRQQPVIVDFWAPWCGPCKTLGPILEKTVKAARGKVKLVKVDIDKNQRIAQQLRIQSIPAVYAFQNGQPVDGFVGALPESQVKAFVNRLAGASGPSPIEEVLGEAKAAIEAGDTQGAVAIYQEVLAQEPDNAAALGGIAKLLAQNGQIDQAKQFLAKVPADLANNADVVAAKAAIALSEQTSGAGGDTAEFKQKLAANPNDHQARIDLALALLKVGDKEAAIDELLESIKRDRNWNEQAARNQLLKLFEAFGATDPLTKAGRRKLSSLLFS